MNRMGEAVNLYSENLIQKLISPIKHQTSYKTNPREIEEYNEYVLQQVCKTYAYLLPQIYEIILLKGTAMSNDYKKDLLNQIDHLIEVYNIKTIDYLVSWNLLDLPYWSAAIWTFLHCTSILIQDGLQKQIIKYVLDLPNILYNLEEFIPCPNCVQHYLDFKNDPSNGDLLKLLRRLSYGLTVESIYTFHHLISENLKKKPAFQPENFALYYSIMPNAPLKSELATYYTGGVRYIRPEQAVANTLIHILYSKQPNDGHFLYFRDLYASLLEVPKEYLVELNKRLKTDIESSVILTTAAKNLFETMKGVMDANYKVPTAYDPVIAKIEGILNPDKPKVSSFTNSIIQNSHYDTLTPFIMTPTSTTIIAISRKPSPPLMTNDTRKADVEEIFDEEDQKTKKPCLISEIDTSSNDSPFESVSFSKSTKEQIVTFKNNKKLK